VKAAKQQKGTLKLATQEEKDAERKQWDAERQQREQKKLRRVATIRRIKDIVWSAVIASNCAGLADDPSGCRDGTTAGRKRSCLLESGHLHSKISTETGCKRQTLGI
jgi:hypothetical protein